MPDAVSATPMIRVADHVAADHRRRLRQRPADHADGEALRAEDAPQRPGTERRRGVTLLDEKPEPLEPVREAVVGQQLHRPAAARELIDRRRSDAVLLRQLPGRDRRPHRLGRGRVQRRQMADRAGIEDPAEIRQPAFGGGAGDQIERRAVDRDHRDPAARVGPRPIERRIDRPRLEQRRHAAPAQREQRRHRRQHDHDEQRRPDRARLRRPAAQHRQQHAQDRRRRQHHRARQQRPRRGGIEHQRERDQVAPHQRWRRRPRAIAPSQVSTSTLIHAGENTSRASSCRTTSRM